MFKLFFGKTNKNSSTSNSECNQSIIDIQENLININHNIEQIKEKNYKESQINWKFILTTAPLYFSILAFFAILIGAFKTHSYLNNIGYISIFSEIISSPSALIAIVVAYSLMVFLLAIYFSLPFFMFLFLNNSDKVLYNVSFSNNYLIRKVHYFYALTSFTVFIICFSLRFDLVIDASFLFNFGLIYALTLCLLSPDINWLKNKLFLNYMIASGILIFVFAYSYMYPFIYAKIIVSFESRKNWQWVILFLLPTLNLIITNLSFIILKNQNNRTNSKIKDSVLMGIICMYFILLTTGFFTMYTRFSDLSLYVPKFIEKPQNSSWYIIHNGNTNSEKINGLSKTEIQTLKHEFKPKNKDDENIKNPNALYGYMAWNLGNTKVFCPVSVDFFDDKDNNEENSKKCLVIDGKYLQPISKYYLANNNFMKNP
ncbi:MAG: hypothetical protein Q3971_09505 [Moraxella sp.]|nr:hypothetical protein [Moraxella sp.]